MATDNKKVEDANTTTTETKSTQVELQVLIAFKDKITGEKHKKDDIISVDTARAKELLADKRSLVIQKS